MKRNRNDSSQQPSITFLAATALALSVAIATGCAGPTRKPNEDRTIGAANPNSEEIPAVASGLPPSSAPAASPAVLGEIEKEILEADAELGATSPGVRIPLEINEDVRRWIHYFTVTDKERFQRFLQRGEKYRAVIQDILARNGVPPEIYYLGMIESGYATGARSHARAVGPWQFIRGTGLRYGLRQDRTVDERMDIIRSTEAAAKYLLGLHTAFQSWYLAMAGYNAGEGRILGAVIRNGTRDFWELVEQRKIPAETRNYVPKFLAAAVIGRHPEKYGFTDLAVEKFPRVEGASVPGGVRLSSVAARVGIPAETLSKLNPHLLRGVTPRGSSNYVVWVPKGHGDRTLAEATAWEAERDSVAAEVAAATARKPASRKLASHKSGANNVRQVHVIRRGETLYSIANRYQLSVASLKKINRLRSNRIYIGMKLKVAQQSRPGSRQRG